MKQVQSITFSSTVAEAAAIDKKTFNAMYYEAEEIMPLLQHVDTYPSLKNSHLFRGEFRDLYAELAIARDVNGNGATLLWFPFNPYAAWAICFHNQNLPELEAATFFTKLPQAWRGFVGLAKGKGAD